MPAFLVLFLLASGWLHWQDPARPVEKPKSASNLPENFGKFLSTAIEEKLALNAEQGEKLEQLRDEFKEKAVAIRDKTQVEADKIRADKPRLDRAAQRKLGDLSVKMLLDYGRLRGEYEPKLRAMLSEPQKKKYDELLKEQSAPPPKKIDVPGK